MSSFDLLKTGSQSLLTTQSQLSTVSQNINNANTEGYSRQRAIQVSLPERGGSQIQGIERITDSFLTQQVWADQSVYNQASIFASLAGELDDLMATDVTGISSALDDYFDALQNIVDDPVSTPNRELFLAQAETLANRFNELDANLSRQEENLNSRIESYAGEITSIAASVADINDQIRIAAAADNPVNELRDQREKLIEDLSQLIGISVVEADNEQLSIFIGNGQPLVVGKTASQMVTSLGNPDPNDLDIQLLVAKSSLEVTDNLSGGTLGGLLQYRDEVLYRARDELDLIALGFTESMNTQHKNGLTPDNVMGENLFNDINDLSAQTARISGGSFNTSIMNDSSRVEIQDISQLDAGGYTLTYNDENNITLRRNYDGETFRIDLLTAETGATTTEAVQNVDDGEYFLDASKTTLSFAIEGVKVTLETNTSLQQGDKFFINPARGSADQMELVIKHGDQLALASPVRITEDSGNQGTGVATVEVTDSTAISFATTGELRPPLDIVFNNTDPLTYTIYDITDKDNPQVLDLGSGPLSNQTYVAGEAIQVDGFAITISNQPQAGDRFRFEFNEDGVSDNRNALGMSNLQQADLFGNGSYQDLYGSLLERIGNDTATARISEAASKSVLDSSLEAKASVSGVNLDEEAAKLVQYQQAYQASSQLIRVAQTIFDSLLSSI